MFLITYLFFVRICDFFSVSLYFFNTLFIETNSLCLIYESIKVLEIKIFLLFNLVFAEKYYFIKTFLFFFFIIDSYFLIATVITQIFNATAELVTHTGILTRKAKAEIETKPVKVEAKYISKC